MVKATKSARNEKSKGRSGSEAGSSRGMVNPRRSTASEKTSKQDAKNMAKSGSSMTDKSRLESLDRAIGQIDKMFGDGSIMRLDGEQPAEQPTRPVHLEVVHLDLIENSAFDPKMRVPNLPGSP